MLTLLAGALWTRQVYVGPAGDRPGRPGDVGGVYHQLRLLGRYRALRHIDLGDPFSVPHALANRGLPRLTAHSGNRGRRSCLKSGR